MWFNRQTTADYFLVPGLIVLVITLIGGFLTSMVIAREWERGTFEALFVTPVRPARSCWGRSVPYFALGMVGLALCLLSARFLFHIPFRGSVSLLATTSALYLLVASRRVCRSPRRPKASSWPARSRWSSPSSRRFCFRGCCSICAAFRPRSS